MNSMLQSDLRKKQLQLQSALQHSNADGCLVTIDLNLYYLCGFIFNGYLYLPTEGEPYYFFKRPAAKKLRQSFTIRKPEEIPALFKEAGVKMPRHLLLEADELSYNEYNRLLTVFQPAVTSNLSSLLRRQRMIKTEWEIAQMKISAAAQARTYGEITACYRSGMTDLQLQFEIEYRMRQNGSLGLFKAFGHNMDIFMGSVLAGANAAIPSPYDFALGGQGMHPLAPLGANGTILKPGNTVMVDMAGNYTSYQTDMTRVFSIGKVNEKIYKAHNLSLEIQEKIMTIAKPGLSCAELYVVAQEIVKREKAEAFFMGTEQQASFIGHGIGLQINELPVLTPRSKEVLLPGMTFALEPKFVIPPYGAAGIENTFQVTETGLEKLTDFREDIISLE